LYAATASKNRTVKALVAAGAAIDLENRKGVTPLIAAAYDGDKRILALLIEAGADPKTVDKTGKSAMFYAAGRGFAKIVKTLHGLGVDVNQVLGNDLTALMWAAGYSNDVPDSDGLATVSLLLGLGAEVGARDNRSRTALMIAASRGHGEVVERLLEAGADPRLADRQGKTARILALQAGKPVLAKLLAGAVTGN
jgi:ankyrin repeat protein